MSATKGNILDSGYWEEVQPNGDTTKWKAAPARASKWWADLVRPSFMTRTGGSHKLRRTAYLDGLRGFACILVYWGHHQLWSRDMVHADAIFENAYGYKGQYYFATLPIIRTFFSGGHFSVTVFFVISGYVLSTKPLSLINSGDHSKLGDNLASALFRRWPRLHIPVICTTFLYMCTWHAFGIWVDGNQQSNFRDELWNFYAEFKNFSFAYRTGGESWFTYDFHVWSIPVEYRGSLIVYTCCLAFSRLTRNARLLGEIGMMFYFMYIVDGWFGAMSMSGMLLADLDILAEKDDLPGFFKTLEPYKKPIFYTMFLVSVLLGGCPSHSSDINVLRESPGWYYLSFLKPQAVFDFKWFYLFWASLMVVASIPRIPWLKAFFETRFCQYMGRISFSFYLVHGPVLWTLADRLYVAAGWVRESHVMNIPQWVNKFPLPKGGPLGFDLAFLLPHLIIFPLTLWLSEMVTKLFDEPSVRFSAWMYKTALAPADNQAHEKP